MPLPISTVRPGLVVDTGPLLVYAFGTFRNGELLARVLTHVPIDEHGRIQQVLTEVLSNARRVLVTPQVFTEFQVVAQNRAKLSSKVLGEFLLWSLPVFQNAEQYGVGFADLVEFKSKTDSWHLSFVDSSLLLAAIGSRLPILTMDRPLANKCGDLSITAIHLIEIARKA